MREVPASYGRSEQTVAQEDNRIVAGYVEFREVSVEEVSTRAPTRSRGRRSRIRLVGDLVGVGRVALMNHSGWRVWEKALVDVIDHQQHSHLLSMRMRWSSGIGSV